jgi:hypothetical protein
MDAHRYIDEQTLTFLKQRFPDTDFVPQLTTLKRSSRPAVHIDLPLPPGADYFFRLYLDPERQIHARLANANAKDYFWYMPFEDAAFGNSVEKLDREFLRTIELLLAHETRIVQKRSLVTHSFRCEYKSANGWSNVCGHSALRLGRFHVPEIKDRERIYSSPALVPK